IAASLNISSTVSAAPVIESTSISISQSILFEIYFFKLFGNFSTSLWLIFSSNSGAAIKPTVSDFVISHLAPYVFVEPLRKILYLQIHLHLVLFRNTGYVVYMNT